MTEAARHGQLFLGVAWLSAGLVAFEVCFYLGRKIGRWLVK